MDHLLQCGFIMYHGAAKTPWLLRTLRLVHLHSFWDTLPFEIQSFPLFFFFFFHFFIGLISVNVVNLQANLVYMVHVLGWLEIFSETWGLTGFQSFFTTIFSENTIFLEIILSLFFLYTHMHTYVYAYLINLIWEKDKIGLLEIVNGRLSSWIYHFSSYVFAFYVDEIWRIGLALP